MTIQVGRSSSTRRFSLAQRCQFLHLISTMSTMSLRSLALVGLSCVGATPYTRSISATCPAIWTQISSELTPVFRGFDGQCTDLARAAIRFAFHDAGTSRSRSLRAAFLLLMFVVQAPTLPYYQAMPQHLVERMVLYF